MTYRKPNPNIAAEYDKERIKELEDKIALILNKINHGLKAQVNRSDRTNADVLRIVHRISDQITDICKGESE